jgi:hypothetical protein
MSAFIRIAGAAGILFSIATGAIASPVIEQAFTMPEWAETCSLPSATASSDMIQDESVQLTSGAEESADDDAKDKTTSMSNEGHGGYTTYYYYSSPSTCYASVGVVVLKRQRPNGGTAVGTNPGGTPSFFDVSAFDFGWDEGPDLTIGWGSRTNGAWEGRFFRVESEADTSLVTPGGFIGGGFTGPAGTTFDNHYLTKLTSSELNYRAATDGRVTWLYGFRWIELHDEVYYKINGNVATGDYEYNNRLYGGQVGADVALSQSSNPLQFNIVGKGGLYGNVADGGIFEYQGNNFIGSFVGQDVTSAFVGELNFNGTYYVSRSVSITGGYQLLWLNNVATGSEASSRSLLNPSLLRTVNDHNTLFYNGATAALNFAY